MALHIVMCVLCANTAQWVRSKFLRVTSLLVQQILVYLVSDDKLGSVYANFQIKRGGGERREE